MIGNKLQALSFIQSLQPTAIIEVKEIKETRSVQQNRLYWQWLGDITRCFEEKGIFITIEDLHEGLKDKLIPGNYKTNPLTHRRIHEKKTTTQLNKKEFSEYIKNIEKYLWQTFEVTYPLPSDFFYEKKL